MYFLWYLYVFDLKVMNNFFTTTGLSTCHWPSNKLVNLSQWEELGSVARGYITQAVLVSTVDYGMYAVGLLHSVCDRDQRLFQWVASPCSNSIAELLLCVSLTHTHIMVASSPGHSQILSRSCGEKSGEGLGSKLCHRPEMVDSVSTNRVHVTH